MSNQKAGYATPLQREGVFCLWDENYFALGSQKLGKFYAPIFLIDICS